ncbi:MAG: PilN domain-containing protein [Prochlorococcaceae cyanobacterium]
MTRSPGSIDLLRQRRVELGLPEQPAAPTDSSRLLLMGSLAGAAFVLLSLLVWLGFRFRLQALETEAASLADVPVQLKSLQGEFAASNGRVIKLKAVNKGLADGLVSVRSGSALLRQLSLITPAGVQLTSGDVQGNTLTLKGLAADPQAFRRINALQLQLANSPLFDPLSAEVVKVSREPAKSPAQAQPGATPATQVTFELTVEFSPAAQSASLAELQRLGAEGMAQRLRVLRRAEVLP